VTAAWATRLAAVELAAAREEVEVAEAAAELKALSGSSADNSVSGDDNTNDELRLAREAAQEQAAQWAAVHDGTLDRHRRADDAPDENAQSDSLDVRERAGGAPDAAVGSTKIVTSTGGVALPPRIGTMVTARSKPLPGTSVSAVGGLPSPRPTTSSGLR
jgi:hypothetical protein